MQNNPPTGVRPIEIEKEMRSSYLDYAMSVIVSRALPDVRDGLKPVQRRILYAMHDQGMRPGTAYKKSARLVGEVLGKYHPHSDTAVYDAQVRMAQSFSMRYQLVDGQGNYGSVDGDPPAAMRYTECRLARITDTLITDIDRDTVNWNDNFDQSLKEPSVLPARLPNLLANGAAGIAVGMATNIPPHNLSELCDGIIHLIDNPTAGVEELMQHVKGPDFPTGAHIWGTEGIKNTYTTGRGRIVMQADHTIEDMSQDRKRLVINALPYQVNKSSVVARIAEMIKKRILDGVSEIRDESDRKGMRIVLELRRIASPEVVLNNCYMRTDLRKAFNANLIALIDGTPRVLTLKHALVNYIDFRREIVRRRTEFELKRAQSRQHILQGLLLALGNIDRVIQIIRTSDSVENARANLITEFNLTRIQAQAILDMQLRRLAALEREKLEQEYHQLTTLIADLEDLLAKPERIQAVVKEETQAIQTTHGDQRKSVLHQAEIGNWQRADIEPHKEVVITLSQAGYVKRVDSSTYKAQHRGGKGVRGQSITREGDVIPRLQVADTHDHLLFFTNRGRVFSTRVFELPAEQSRKSRGTPVQNLIQLAPHEEVHSILATSNLYQNLYLVFATRKGKIKRMPLALVRIIRRSGLICCKIKPGDEIVSVVLAKPDQDIVMVTENGLSIRYSLNSIRSRGRLAGGVRGIRLMPNDRVVGLNIVSAGDELMVVTRKGFGKISAMKNYRTQNRGGKGLLTLRITAKNGPVAATAVIPPDIRQDSTGRLFLLTEKAQVLRTNLSEIRSTGRVTQGVKLVIPDKQDAISAIRIIGERASEVEQVNMDDVMQLETGNSDETDESPEDIAVNDAPSEGLPAEPAEEDEQT